VWQDGNYCKGHNEQQLTCSIGLLTPCPHHLYNNNSSHTLKHLPQCLDKLHSSRKSRLRTTPFMNTSVVAWCAGAPSVNLLLN
jgi:hypothetical protein